MANVAAPGHMPGFLPLGAPPSSVGVVEGRDIQNRDGPPPPLGQGARMPHHTVLPPYGLPPSMPRKCLPK